MKKKIHSLSEKMKIRKKLFYENIKLKRIKLKNTQKPTYDF